MFGLGCWEPPAIGAQRSEGGMYGGGASQGGFVWLTACLCGPRTRNDLSYYFVDFDSFGNGRRLPAVPRSRGRHLDVAAA